MKTLFIERKFSADQRKTAAKSGAAMSDGSFPIENKQDLENAIRAVGRASNPAAAKAHIKTRAKALGASDLLPDDWSKESFSLPETLKSLMVEADGVTPREGSFDAIRSRVQSALDKAVRSGADMDCDGDDDSDSGCYCWVRDLFPDSVVYQMDGDLFQCDYQDDGETVTLGTPFEVENSYTAASNGTENEDEAFRESAADTAGAKTLKGHYVQNKSEVGQHSAIYKVASVDPDGSATLHGPVGKGGSRTVSHKDLVSNHMDLGASDQLSMVYAAESFQESGRSHRSENSRKTYMASVSPMQEAAYDAAKGLLTMTIIKPGLNKSGERFYPADVLKRDHKIFEGNKMFVNHQTEREMKERPEGSISDWGATLKKVWAENDGTIKGQAAVIDPPLKAKLEELQKQGLLSDMGVSIRALGESAPGEVAGKKTNIVESLLRSRSVDFVTHAGAGGQVEVMESDRFAEDEDLVNLALVSEGELRARAPKLVQLIESHFKEKEKEIMTDQEIKALQAKVVTLETQLQEATTPYSEKKFKALEAENVKLAKQIEEAEVKEKKSVAAAKLAEMLKESKLPEAAQKRLIARFKDSTTDEDFKEAINEEKDYIKSIGGKSEVRDLGEDRAGGGDRKQAVTARMNESFERFAPKPASA